MLEYLATIGFHWLGILEMSPEATPGEISHFKQTIPLRWNLRGPKQNRFICLEWLFLFSANPNTDKPGDSVADREDILADVNLSAPSMPK